MAVEREQAAVIAVRSTAEGNVGDGAAGVAEFGIEVRGGDIDGGDGFGGGHQSREIAVIDLVLDSLDLKIVELAALAVDANGEAVLGVVELGVLAGRAADSRHEQ